MFTPVLAKHSKSFSLLIAFRSGWIVCRGISTHAKTGRGLAEKRAGTDVTAKVVIYEAFVEGKLGSPQHLARTVHDLYYELKYEEFRPRPIWSLSNALWLASFLDLHSGPLRRPQSVPSHEREMEK